MTASVCVPKIACPNDCSGAGVCDYSTGTCKCEEYRYGDDCSTPICRKFHEFCTVCSAEKCLECIEKHYVDPSTGGCASCAQKHDPRCFRCDENKCLQCADPMLSSVQRSGKRPEDPDLPFEEDSREFSQKFPFGTQDPRYFDEVEDFEVHDGPHLLSDSSVDCAQGLQDDASWSCTPRNQSHKVCGHSGVVAFSSLRTP